MEVRLSRLKNMLANRMRKWDERKMLYAEISVGRECTD